MSTTLSTDGTAQTDQVGRGRHLAPRPRGRLRAIGTMPVQLVGSLMGRGAVSTEPRRRRSREDVPPAPRGPVAMPAADGTIECVVLDGEAPADVAARFGVSTASVLALNALSWKATLVAGQTVRVRPVRSSSPATAAPSGIARHAVGDGETVSAVASRYGVSTAALLLANGLSRGSAVFPGQQLVIPIGGARRGTGEVLALTGEMRDNAAVIVTAGIGTGAPDDALVIALCAAMQDSSLRNLDFAERVGIGLFHRQPDTGWGSRSDLLDPEQAARAFFGGPGRVTAAAGLLDTPGWALMAVGEAAGAVQGSPNSAGYAKWEDCARAWVEDLVSAG